MVVSAEVANQYPEHGLVVERAGCVHVLEIGPVSSPVEEGFEHGQVPAGEKRDIGAAELLDSGPASGGLVERGGVQEDVQWCGVPPQPALTVGAEFTPVDIGHRHACGECCHSRVDVVDADEEIHVDVDGSSGLLGAPGESQCPAESVGNVSFAEGTAESDDPLDQIHRPNTGNMSFEEWRAGNSAASSRTAASSAPLPSRRSPRIRGLSSRSRANPAAATMRSTVEADGDLDPDSYAAIAE